MKRLISFILICLILLSAVSSLEVFADGKKDVQPFFTDVSGEGLAVKNDGTLWEFDAYEFSVKKYADDVKKAYYSYLEEHIDGRVYYLIKKDDSLWRVMDYNGDRRQDKWTKLMDDVQDFTWEKGVGGSANFGYYALKNDGTVLCWGDGGTGIPGARNALEEGGAVSVSLNNAVTLTTDVRMLNVGYLVKNDDTLWTWGWGRRPYSDKYEDFEYPVKIMDDVKSVYGNYIIKTDNSLWVWGDVRYPGNGTDNYNNLLQEPVKIMDDVKKVSGNLALKTDGTVYIWGAIETETFPQCSDVMLVPTKIEEGVRDISQSSAGNIMMLKNNGELWFYGYHKRGENGSKYAPYKLMNLCSFTLTGPGTIIKGEETVITAEYYDEYGNLRYDSDVSWECDDYHLLSHVPNGNTMSVKGLSKGIAHIKATHNPTGEVAEFELCIKDYDIKIEGRKPLGLDEEIELKALLYSGEERSYDAADYEWEIVEKEYAEVTQHSGTGNSYVKIKGKKKGIATVKVTEKNSGTKEEFKLLVALPPNIIINATTKKAEYGITQADFKVTNKKYPELDYDKLTEEEYKSLTLVNPRIDLNLAQWLYAASGHYVSSDYTRTPSVFVYEDMIPGSSVDFSYNFIFGDEALTSDDAFVTVAVYGDGYVPHCKHFDLDVDLPVKVYVNGEKVEFDTRPVISGGRTLVPIRKIFNALGTEDKDIDWNNEEKKATAIVNGKKIVLIADSITAYIDGVENVLDEPARILSGDRTYVPVRFIAEAFGANVHWENSSYTICIGSGKKIESENNKISDIKPDKKGEDAGFTTEEKEKWFGFGETYNIYNGGEVAKGTYQVENLVIKEPLVLPARTKILVKGYLNIENKVSFGYGSEINVVGGDVNVKKKGILDMEQGGTLVCDESFVFNSGTNHNPYLFRGIIEVGGDVTLKRNFYASGENEFCIKNKGDLHIIDVDGDQQFNILKVEARGFEVLDIKKGFNCAKSLQLGSWDVLTDYTFDNVFELASCDKTQCTDPTIKSRVETGLTRAIISESLGSEIDLGQLSKLTKNMKFKDVKGTKTYEYYDADSKSIKKYTLDINYHEYMVPGAGFGTVTYKSGGETYKFVIWASPEKAEEMLTSFKATVVANMADSVVGAYKSNYVNPVVNNVKNVVKELILKELPPNIKTLVIDAEEIKTYTNSFKKITDMLSKLQ